MDNTLSVISQRALQIFDALKVSRESILELNNNIANAELQALRVKDELTTYKANAFIDAATATNTNGKLINPNLTAQEMATEAKLYGDEEYQLVLQSHRKLLQEIQVDKNNITFQHELRGDLKAEAEFLKACIRTETA